MSVRPARKVQLCPTPGGNFFVQDEICVEDGAGNVSEVMRFRTLDPTTLATIAERIVDTLTGLDATGTPVACPCDDAAGGGALCADLAALPISGVAPTAATTLVGGDCQKYTLAQIQGAINVAITNTLTFLGGTLTGTVNGQAASVNLRGNVLQDLAGNTLGYLLPTA